MPENLVSRDGFGSPVPCQPAHLHTLAESGALFVFSSYTCNRRSYIWDYVEPREAFCYFLRIVSPNGCLVLPLSVTPFFSFPLLFSPLFSFLLLSSFLKGGNKYVLSCVIQHEAGGLSKTLATLWKYLAQTW